MDSWHRPSQARTEHEIKARLSALEERPATRVESVDAGGVAWNPANPGWLDPADFTEWTELRVSNTTGGASQVWRALSNGTSLVWTLSA